MRDNIKEWLTSALEIIWTIALFVFIYWLSPWHFTLAVSGIAVLFLLAVVGIFLEKHPALTGSFNDFSNFLFKKHAVFLRRYAITILLSALFIITELFSSRPDFLVVFSSIFVLWIIRGFFQLLGAWLQWRSKTNARTENLN